MGKILRSKVFIIVCLIIFASSIGIYYQSQKESSVEKLLRLEEIAQKSPSQITGKEMELLASELDSRDYKIFVALVLAGAVDWATSQTDAKDFSIENVIFKLNAGGPFLYHIKIRRASEESFGLANWLRDNEVEFFPIDASPKPPTQEFFEFIRSGEGIVAIGVFLALSGLFAWIVFFSPSAKATKFVRDLELKPEKNDTRFSDIAGVDEAVEESREPVDILLDFKEAQKQKKKNKGSKKSIESPDDFPMPEMIKGVLLVGPPGNGKTLIARAIAGEAGVPFFSLNGSDFVEVFVGVGAARMRALFKIARKKAPCIIFIDEIDAVGKKRQPDLGFGGESESANTLNAFLSQFDGFDKETPILLIGATNRPDILDDALLRPGRFSRKVVLDNPDISGRKAILSLYIKRLTKIIAEDVSIDTLAKQTPGFSGAGLSNFVNEAHILLQRERRKNKEATLITEAHFEEALDRVLYGPAKVSRVLSSEEKGRFALHEAGHAIVAYKLESESEETVHKVSIIHRGHIGGHVQLLKNDNVLPTRTQVNAQMSIYTAGFVAEEIEYGKNVSVGSSSDVQYVNFVATSMVKKWLMGDVDKLGFRNFEESSSANTIRFRGDDLPDDTKKIIDGEIKELTLDARRAAKLILEEEEEKLHYLTDRLVEEETISGDELREILESPVPAQK